MWRSNFSRQQNVAWAGDVIPWILRPQERKGSWDPSPACPSVLVKFTYGGTKKDQGAVQIVVAALMEMWPNLLLTSKRMSNLRH